jgi:hypothetical protein
MTSRNQVYGWSHSFKEGRTPSAQKDTASGFWESQDVLFIDFLTEWRTINVDDYSKLLKDRIKPAFCSKRRSWSVKRVCLFHDNARPHTAAVTTGTLEEMHREVLPYPPPPIPDVAPSYFHVLGPPKGALGGKWFRADDEVKLFVQRWLDEQSQTYLKGCSEGIVATVMVCRGERKV